MSDLFTALKKLGEFNGHWIDEAEYERLQPLLALGLEAIALLEEMGRIPNLRLPSDAVAIEFNRVLASARDLAK